MGQPPQPKIAWVTGASGFWGRKTALSLLRKDWHVVALCRSEPTELMEWAEAQQKYFQWISFDLLRPNMEIFMDQALSPSAFFHCAAVFDADFERMAQVNIIQPILIMEKALASMEGSGYGRLGVYLGQNGRLGLPNLGKFSATQGALWTWAESQVRTYAKFGNDIRVSLVFPPRAPSTLQKELAKRLSKPPKLSPPPTADALVAGVLAGKKRVGRRPLIAGLSTLIT